MTLSDVSDYLRARAKSLNIDVVEAGDQKVVPLTSDYTPTMSSIHLGKIFGGVQLEENLCNSMLAALNESAAMPIISNSYKETNNLLNQFTLETKHAFLKMVARAYKREIPTITDLDGASKKTIKKSIENHATYPMSIYLGGQSSAISNGEDNADDIASNILKNSSQADVVTTGEDDKKHKDKSSKNRSPRKKAKKVAEVA
eukprot:6460002-Amphidinium_carterae.1